MSRTVSRQALILIVLICALLPALAVMQYRWLGELSGLERVRAQRNLSAGASRLSTEFDGALAGVFSKLAAIDSENLDVAGRRRELMDSGLVMTVYSVDVTGRSINVHELDATGRQQRPTALPPALKRRLDSVEPGRPLFDRTMLDDVPAVVFSRHPNRWLIAVLDARRIGDEVLPRMLAGCLEGGIPGNYDVLIIADDAPDQTVYRSSAQLSKNDFDPDRGGIPLFAIHGRDVEPGVSQLLHSDAAAHRWRLYVQYQGGPLEATLAEVRQRNMAIGLGVLALLAACVGLLVMLAHRMQRVARQQLEFVARLSHELRTPLASLTCAGENLEDGVVKGPAEVRSYGNVIRRESARLGRAVTDILLCCRLQAKPDQVLARQRVNIAEVIRGAIDDCRATVAKVDVELAVTPDIAVLGDHQALRMAVKNLILNACTHGHGSSVRITADWPSNSPHVQIAVEDRGPGIAPSDLSNVFKPFFRGQRTRELPVEGTGIGLSIVNEVVRGHKGRMLVHPVTPTGVRFVVQLPDGVRESDCVEPAA